MTTVQRQLIVDLDRMAMALDSDSVHTTLAMFIARRHMPNNGHGMLRRLCHEGYLRLRTERYELTEKPLPLARDCAVGSPPASLDDKFFSVVATEWRSGNRSVETFFMKIAETEREESFKDERQISLQQIERVLSKPRTTVNGSRTASASWGTIMADHLLLQMVKGQGLSTIESVRLLAHHHPHLTAPQSKQTALRSKGLLDTSGRPGQRDGRWSVSKAAEEAIERLGMQPSLTQDQARAMLDP